MEGLDVDGILQHYRLNPTEVEAVTYYLPRLISGETLHGAEKLIHRVYIYDWEPKNLAARYAPVPQAVSSGDRFFFITCKSKNGSKLQSVRSAGGGTWAIQKTTEITHAGGKVGEIKNLSFKKKGKSTGWVMEEYRCLLREATVAEGVKVFCRMHLAQHAPDAARQESAAYKLQGRPKPTPQPELPHKRPAPATAADPHPPRPKKRMCVAVPASCESTTTSNHSDVAYSSHDQQRQAQAPEISSQPHVLESVMHYSQQEIVPEAGSSIASSTSEEGVFESLDPISNLLDGEEDGFDLEKLMRMMEADPIEVEPVTGGSWNELQGTGANTGVEISQQGPL
ncbi:Protein CUP-SHAPED COTYLEDON 3 [Hordeum vulgare]|nr:Protein CUP-SHAPED COTYLEDON 3 [Hordeum vulgare]